MKFTAEELFDIAKEEYRKADFLPEIGSVKYHTWAEGVGQWAYESANQEYTSLEDVRYELQEYIKDEKNSIEE